MECISPPEIEEGALLRYLDDRADERVAGHIERCPHCRERAQRLARADALLRATLYRAGCPSSLELGEFNLHMLPRKQATVVARHVAECPHCRREISLLQGYLGDVAPDLEASPVERIKVIVAQLVSAGGELGRLTGLFAPAYAGVRGDSSGPRIYSADGAQIAVDIQDDQQRPGLRIILGLITGIDASGWLVQLWQAGKQVAQSAADEIGNFVFTGVAPARYAMVISGPDTEIRIEELEIGAG